ncbi:MAG: ATP-binding cassette domain-containing protein [Gemmatimonadota bacterium]|nr:MAG: ATP-binding cassette domain-containing protein [Gemmatimonadota bacterium]
MLSLVNVSKSFDRIEAVRSVDLEVQEGQTTVLIGPSGCGKSTILRLIIGLVSPDSGTIAFRGERILPETVLRLRRRMGYVIQEGGLFPHFTTRQNITLMASYLGWSRSEIERRLSELIELTQFPADGLSRYPAHLSGGQRQRVSLMRALMLDPELLLMDEPLGALDPLIRFDVQAELKSIFQKLHKTVLMVTHDLGEAAYLGDTMILMRDGLFIQEGTIEELVRSPADPFVTRFINAQRGHLEKTSGEQV